MVVNSGYDVKLYLCGGLWQHPYLAMDSYSWVEVLVHELAHLVDQPNGSIVDFTNPTCEGFGDKCYEYPNALRLVTHCPNCGQRSAENYAGFAVESFMRAPLFSALF